MKNVMIVALLSGMCVAGEHVAPNRVGAPLQAPVLFVLAAAAAQGNNEQMRLAKPKRSNPKAKRKREYFNHPTRERYRCRDGYRVKR